MPILTRTTEKEAHALNCAASTVYWAQAFVTFMGVLEMREQGLLIPNVTPVHVTPDKHFAQNRKLLPAGSVAVGITWVHPIWTAADELESPVSIQRVPLQSPVKP